jgi:hypothetical protein
MLSKLDKVINEYALEKILEIKFCQFYVLDLAEYDVLKVSKNEEDIEKLKEINKKLGVLRFRDDTIGFVDWNKQKRIYITSIFKNAEKKIIKHLKGNE